jgi:hypothetical protein
MKKIVIATAATLLCNAALGDTMAFRRTDHNNMIPGYPFCEIGFGATRQEALENFLRTSFHVGDYKVEGHCRSGWSSLVRTKGGVDGYACGWSCGAQTRQAAESRAIEECKAFGVAGGCTDVWSYHDDGGGLVRSYRNGDLWWPR